MKKPTVSRRKFVMSAGVFVGTSLSEVIAQPPARIIPVRPCSEFVRREFSTLTTAQVDSLKYGIRVMMSRSPTDPTSWIYQANIHGTLDKPAHPLWSGCQHNTLHFFTWHRMYLYYFERILREASGDPTLTLPFWNYSNPATQMLPLAFRKPATETNPLYVSARNEPINAGVSLPPSAVDFSQAFSRTSFSGDLGFSRTLEYTPHGVIHTTIGGFDGFMSFFHTAGRDPIFWLHHCNIDRLWNRWLDQEDGRTNPVTDAAWMGQTYDFFDENGRQVTLAVRDILSNRKQLGYCYSDDKIPLRWPSPIDPRLEPILASAADGVQKQIAKSQNLSEELRSKPHHVTIDLDASALDEINRVLNAKEKVRPELVLNIEEIELDRVPDGYYEVYLNLPQRITNPSHRTPHYVGNLSFFGLGNHAGHGGTPKPSFKLGVTDAVRRLQQNDLWNETMLTITFIERTVKAPGTAVMTNDLIKAKFARVSLTVE